MKRWYVGDVMTVDVVTVSPEMGYKAVAGLLVERSVSAVPVVDAGGIVLGVVSEADLLAKLESARPGAQASVVSAADAVPDKEGSG